MKRAIGKASLAVMGLFAYLILSIQFYNNAMAADGPDPFTVGYWYTQFHGDSRSARNDAIIMVSNTIMAATYGMAMGDPLTEELSAEWANTRSAQMRECLGNGTHEDVAEFFYAWAVAIELDADVWMGAAVALFADSCVRSANPKEET